VPEATFGRQLLRDGHRDVGVVGLSVLRMLLELLDVQVEEPGVQDVLGAITKVRKVKNTHAALNAGLSTVSRRGAERLGFLERG
jgi:hypothetical protein